MTVRVFSDQAGTTAAAANDNIGKVEDLSKFDSDGVSSTTGPYLSVDANGFGSADILGQGGDVVQTFTNAIADGSALVVGTSKCIFFSNVNVEAGGTLTIGPAGDMINTNGLNLIGNVVSVATTTKVLTTAEQNSIATFFAERGANSVVVNDETVYDVNSVEADVVLDFNGSSFYRNVPHYFKLGGTYSTFADAFTGNSPKLTYSTTSNSTMTNSAGNIVWAPHNLALNSATPATQTIAVRSGAQYTVRVTGTGSMALSGAGTGTATDGSPATITASTTSLTITLTGSLDTVAVYRSDLGGMAQVPGAVGDFQSYVPTNGSAEYLPRVGHHVYNGSAWVNEGLLIESEARSNLVAYSEDFSNAAWGKFGGGVIVADAATSPDGTSSASQFYGSDGAHVIEDVSVTAGTTYTCSVFLKTNGTDVLTVAINYRDGGVNSINYYGVDFNTATGVISAPALGVQATASNTENFGNGWFRLSIIHEAPATTTTARLYMANRTGANASSSDGYLLYGAQLEAGSTPSSYMPTNGGTYTRTAQSLEVPPAEFGWNSDAVSLQMDGRITYADEGVEEQQTLFAWGDPTASNYIVSNVDTDSTDTGEVNFEQDNAGTTDTKTSDAYTPGVLVPFNIASRHGSTFINGAADGVALTANTTPTALPDLSGTDLQIAHDFMGTIGQFRQFAGDIGDTGLVTATNPSTEPTLSLTFDGTGGSFYNLNWSE